MAQPMPIDREQNHSKARACIPHLSGIQPLLQTGLYCQGARVIDPVSRHGLEHVCTTVTIKAVPIKASSIEPVAWYSGARVYASSEPIRRSEMSITATGGVSRV